eukprot:6182076-Pleurochrysis_carterae.AAC.1
MLYVLCDEAGELHLPRPGVCADVGAGERHSPAGSCRCEADGTARLPALSSLVKIVGKGGESGGGGNELHPGREAATPRSASDCVPSVPFPSRLYSGRGQGDGEGEEVVLGEVGGIPCLVGGMEDQRRGEEPSRDVGAAGPCARNGDVGRVTGNEESGGGGSYSSSRGGSSGKGA